MYRGGRGKRQFRRNCPINIYNNDRRAGSWDEHRLSADVAPDRAAGNADPAFLSLDGMIPGDPRFIPGDPPFYKAGRSQITKNWEIGLPLFLSTLPRLIR